MTSGSEFQQGVSVIVVTRDRADVLESCLDSVIAQSRRPDEIVIVAGCCRSYPDTLHRKYDSIPIRCLYCDVANISVARNMGLEHASHDVVMFIDDDAVAGKGWVQSCLLSFEHQKNASMVGGHVIDARSRDGMLEFAFGLIRSDGRQIEVREEGGASPPGYRRNVKGCNFAINRSRLTQSLQFDEFFRFAFDEADLAYTIHENGGDVVHESTMIVDHLHAPGAYRSDAPMDRDWHTEFASHSRFMLKHTRGLMRLIGWKTILIRLTVHAARLMVAILKRQVAFSQAARYAKGAASGVMYAVRFGGNGQAFHQQKAQATSSHPRSG